MILQLHHALHCLESLLKAAGQLLGVYFVHKTYFDAQVKGPLLYKYELVPNLLFTGCDIVKLVTFL